ncbi:MAG: PEP-CTERM sorting domain-containing protein [Pseudomonadota bacterium]
MLPFTKIQKFSASTLLGLAAAFGAPHAHATPAWTLDPDFITTFRADQYSFNEVFTVGGSNISVTGLGAFDDDGNGFTTAGGIPVGLYRDSDGALLASATIQSGDTLLNTYRFQNISPLTLLANTTYRIVAANLGDNYSIVLPDSVNPALTQNGYSYCVSTSLTVCDDNPGTGINWMANFYLSDDANGNGNSVPEPATLALFGFGCAALAFVRRRQGRGQA